MKTYEEIRINRESIRRTRASIENKFFKKKKWRMSESVTTLEDELHIKDYKRIASMMTNTDEDGE